MKKLMLLAAGLALAVTTGLAQGQTVKGTLIDNMCFNPSMSKDKLAGHTKDCLLMDSCVESGYGLVTADGKHYKLDAKGNETVLAQIKKSNRTNDFKVTVNGTVKGETLTVSSIAIDE